LVGSSSEEITKSSRAFVLKKGLPLRFHSRDRSLKMVRAVNMVLLGVAIGQGAYATGDDSKPAGHKPGRDQPLHALLVARADAIGKAYQARHDQFLVGRGTLNFYLSTAQRLRDAELALAANADERLAILDQFWLELWSCERIERKRFTQGRVAVQDCAEATSRRLEAEIALVDALAGRPDAAAAGVRRAPGSRFSEQTRANADQTSDRDLTHARSMFPAADPKLLRGSMLEADKEAFVAFEKEFLAGRGTLPFQTAAVIRLRDTELASSQTAFDRFAALEACWMTLRQNEAVTQARFVAGTVPALDVMDVRYARLATEQPLHDVRQSAPENEPWPSVCGWRREIIMGATLKIKDLVHDEVDSMLTSSQERAKTMLHCAQEAWDARQKGFQDRRGALWFLLDAARRRSDAQLALAPKPAERMDSLKQYLRELEDIEEVLEQRYQGNFVQIEDVMDARWARLDLEVRMNAEPAK
jgi:hypothetical protein